MESYKSLVWKILSGIPVAILDESTNSVWHGHLWELAQPRTEGELAGSRLIGTANIVAAYNLLHSKLIQDDSASDSIQVFRDVLAALEADKRIRQQPERLRSTFKSIK